jgi:hypothetical protein
MVLKNTLNGNKIPICRVEDLEITLVSPNLSARVKLPSRNEQAWRSLSEVRAAEVQCMQLSLALLARHESEMYVSLEGKAQREDYTPSDYNGEQCLATGHQQTSLIRKHIQDCERVFGDNPNSRSSLRSVDESNEPNESIYPLTNSGQTRSTRTSSSLEPLPPSGKNSSSSERVQHRHSILQRDHQQSRSQRSSKSTTTSSSRTKSHK